MSFMGQLKDMGFGRSGNALANAIGRMNQNMRARDFNTALVSADSYLDMEGIQKISEKTGVPLFETMAQAEQMNKVRLSSRLKQLMPQIMSLSQDPEYQGAGGVQKIMKELNVDPYEMGPMMEVLQKYREERPDWDIRSHDPEKDLIGVSGTDVVILREGKEKPADSPHKIGDLRKYERNGKKITEHWDGEKWAPLSESDVTTPSTNVTIDMRKPLPASTVEKAGEMQAYKATINSILDMAKEKKLDTGPLEFLKEIADNLGVPFLSSTARMNLRALVSRLPGLMYAMRGKQLSDKELEVALKMMPKMNQDEEAFMVNLVQFEDYMNKVTEGKWNAFRKSGYKYDVFAPEKGDKKPDANVPDPEKVNKLGSKYGIKVINK